MDHKKLLEFLRREAQITVHAREDDIPVRGNALASGDDAEDKRCEDAILERLERGDVWAWACVEVRASWDLYDGSDYLGACSYDSEEDFRQQGDYFDDMVDEALEVLAGRIESAANGIDGLKARVEQEGA